jgi:AAA domain/LAGLIDADG-like domain
MQLEDDLTDIDLTEDDFPPPVRCSLITGAAGTGKTYMVRERINREPKEGVLCATTGIAAVNLNTITINALLRYFDTDSLTNAYIHGKLTSRLAALAKMVNNVYIDEVSMMAAEQLDIIYQATQAANRQKGVQKVNSDGLGIVLTGDFAQLPPIKARWAFEAECWPGFESGFLRLTHNWRQGEGRFLDAVNCFRSGKGDDGASLLRETSAQFTNALSLDFDGTTIMSKNDEVDRFNWVALRRLKTPSFRIQSDRWSVNNPPGEWKFIPPELELKVGAYVMVLANHRDFEYANGDCGWVVDYESDADVVSVKLARNGKIVDVHPVERLAQTDDFDDRGDIPVYKKADYASGEPRPWEIVHFDEISEKYVVGAIRYMPLRLAWASTVHKCVSPDERIPVIGKGFIPIKEAQENDMTPYGPVKAKAITTQRAYRITTHRGYEVICSSNHRWMTECGLRETWELEIEEDRLQLVSTSTFNGTNFIDSELAWWLGATVGDGCYTDRKEGQLHFANIDREIGDRYKSYIESQGYHASWRKDERGIHSTSKPFRASLEDIGLDYVKAPSKSIPERVWQSGPACWGKFLQGLFDTDGHVGRSMIVLTTRSEILGREVQLMLLLLGIPTKRRCWKTGYKGSGDLYWQVSLGSNSLRRFESEIGFSSVPKKEKLAQIFPNRSIVRFDGYDKIQSIEDLGVDIEMADVEIPSPHLLSFSGIVGHNSQGLTLDRVQLDIRHAFFGSPAMTYVAVSRCRSAEGLRIVGTDKLLAQRCKIDPKITRWI